MHKEPCSANYREEWSGSPDPERPDTHWICDECGAFIPASEETVDND
jgi:hypothetical protein